MDKTSLHPIELRMCKRQVHKPTRLVNLSVHVPRKALMPPLVSKTNTSCITPSPLSMLRTRKIGNIEGMKGALNPGSVKTFTSIGTGKNPNVPFARKFSAVLSMKKHEEEKANTDYLRKYVREDTREAKKNENTLDASELPSKATITSFSQLLHIMPNETMTFINLPRKKEWSKAIPNNSPANGSNCNCFATALSKKYEILRYFHDDVPKLSMYSQYLPILTKKFLSRKKNIAYPNKIVIFNAEVLSLKQNHRKEAQFIRPQTSKGLKALQKWYQLVLVYKQNYPGITALKQYLNSENIKFSGIYQIEYEHSNYCKGILDYSVIYKDFNTHFPNFDVIIAASLQLSNEDIEDASDSGLISYKHGLYTRILIETVPVPYKERQNSPITLLVPALDPEESSILTTDISSILISTKSFSFSDIFLNNSLKLITSTTVSESIFEKSAKVTREDLEDADRTIFCRIHYKSLFEPEPLPANHFAIMRLSKFPSKIKPNLLING